jgi:hypothetical protein
MRERTGDREGAEQLARAGDPALLRNLAAMREQARDQAEAERLYRAAADVGNTAALSALARLREQAGDQAEAERLYRAATDAGDTWALQALARKGGRLDTGGRWSDLLRFGLEADGRVADPW